VPGISVTRYDRIWRIGQWTTQPSGVITGRMGFESREAATTIWDDLKNDFVPAHPRLGQTSPFAIDPETLRIAFQLQGQTIRPWTFRGNFVALLRRASDYRWELHLDGVDQPSWETWTSSIDRLAKVHITMTRPNPRFNDAQIDHLFTDTKSAAVEIVLNASGDESVDIDSYTFIEHCIDHASRYGNYDAVGEIQTASGKKRKETWKLSREGEVKTSDAPQDPSTREIAPDVLRASLRPPTKKAAKKAVTVRKRRPRKGGRGK